MTKFTAKDVEKLHRERIEPDDVPTRVLAVLQAEDGKLLTKRLLAKLPGGEQAWHLGHIASMTHLKSRDDRFSILLAYRLKNIVVDAAWVAEHNPAYFGARVARNALRKAATGEDFTLMAATLNAIVEARAKLKLAEEAFHKLAPSAGSTPFSPDHYFWRDLVAEKDERRR